MDGDLGRALKMQALAILLTGNLPPSVRKKALYALLNEAEMKFSQEELQETEQFFSLPKMKSCPSCSTLQPESYIYCFYCGFKMKTIQSSVVKKEEPNEL